MIRLRKSVEACGTPDFAEVLKKEIESLYPGQLPLQQGLAATNQALDGPLTAMILKVSEDAVSIRVKAGIFFSGIIAGCSCADDPTPVEAQNEYCEMLFEINKATAETCVVICDS